MKLNIDKVRKKKDSHESIQQKKDNSFERLRQCACRETMERCWKKIMVVKGFDNVRVEKQWGVVNIVQNGTQNMCVTKDDIDALKQKGR